ncbi:MAG: glycosyltransferase family 39 protein [Acidobacteria bacterium]|nr:glycosyltransferase family 39 protein [Acidobacteriota bacterium]
MKKARAAPDALQRRGRAAALAFVALGIALRVATAYPVHKYAADADCLNCGFVGLRINEGHPAVWLTPRRAGALECYGHAAAFRAFGPTREALAITPLVSSSLALALYAALVLPLLGPVAGPLAVLLFALPPPAYLFWTYMPNGYPETMLLCLAVLLAAERVRQAPSDLRRLAVLGLVAGLGFWNSIQTLAATIPACLGLLAARPRELARRRAAGVTAAAFLVGALPWIAWNVAVPLGSFQGNFSVQPASGLRALGENARYLLSYALPELVASVDPENGLNPTSALARILRGPVLLVWAAAALFAAWRAWTALAKYRRDRNGDVLRELALPLVALTICALAVLSGAGGMRGLTVRYVLPAFFVLPAALGLAATAAARTGRLAGALAAAAVCTVVVFNLSVYFLPGSAPRRLWEKRLDADSDLIAFLGERGIEAVSGDYWAAYPVNFLSTRRIAGVPFQPAGDFYGVEDSLGGRSLRWAVVGSTRAQIERLISVTGDSGLLVEVAFERWVFIPEVNVQPAAAFLSRYRAAFAGVP